MESIPSGFLRMTSVLWVITIQLWGDIFEPPITPASLYTRCNRSNGQLNVPFNLPLPSPDLWEWRKSCLPYLHLKGALNDVLQNKIPLWSDSTRSGALVLCSGIIGTFLPRDAVSIPPSKSPSRSYREVRRVLNASFILVSGLISTLDGEYLARKHTGRTDTSGIVVVPLLIMFGTVRRRRFRFVVGSLPVIF